MSATVPQKVRGGAGGSFKRDAELFGDLFTREVRVVGHAWMASTT